MGGSAMLVHKRSYFRRFRLHLSTLPCCRPFPAGAFLVFPNSFKSYPANKPMSFSTRLILHPLRPKHPFCTSKCTAQEGQRIPHGRKIKAADV